jgi:hypothetical protein
VIFLRMFSYIDLKGQVGMGSGVGGRGGGILEHFLFVPDAPDF